MIINTKTTSDWYTLEGDFDPPIKLKLRPYSVMAEIEALPDDYDPDAKLTLAQQGIMAAKSVVAEVVHLLEDWDGVELKDGSKAPIDEPHVIALVVNTPGVYMPVRKLLNEHRAKWEKEGNGSGKASRGRRRAVANTAKGVVKRRRRVRKESPELTANGALSSSTSPGR